LGESIAVVSAVGNGSVRSLELGSLYVFRKGAEVPARDYGFSLVGLADSLMVPGYIAHC